MKANERTAVLAPCIHNRVLVELQIQTIPIFLYSLNSAPQHKEEGKKDQSLQPNLQSKNNKKLIDKTG